MSTVPTRAVGWTSAEGEPSPQRPHTHPDPGGWTSAEGKIEGHVLELSAHDLETVALDPTKDVLLQLYAQDDCPACEQLRPLYKRLADRLAQLRIATLVVLNPNPNPNPSPNPDASPRSWCFASLLS